jgi:hypothetical protein
MFFDSESNFVDPANPIDPEWEVPGCFTYSRFAFYVSRCYFSPDILPFAPYSEFVQNKVFRDLLCLIEPVYIPLICRTMIREETHDEVNPLDILGDDEDTEEEEIPLLGREGSARRLGRGFRSDSIEEPLPLTEIQRNLGMGTYAAESIPSVTTEEDLTFLRARFQVPDSVALRVPTAEERACTARPGEVCLYFHSFEAGLRLPFPQIVREVLNYFSIAPSQLVPNAWRLLIGCAALWAASSNKERPLGLNTFLYLFQLKRTPDLGWWYFSPREKEALLSDVPSGVKSWKGRFFFVGGTGWEFPEYEEDRSSTICRSWGAPPSASKFSGDL